MGNSRRWALRETLAYLLEREELDYPGSGELIAPCRWRGADSFAASSWATEFQVLAACMLEREQQIRNGRAIIRAPGFALLREFLLSVTPQQFVDAAGKGGLRGLREAMRAGDVAEGVKRCLMYSTMPYKGIWGFAKRCPYKEVSWAGLETDGVLQRD